MGIEFCIRDVPDFDVLLVPEWQKARGRLSSLGLHRSSAQRFFGHTLFKKFFVPELKKQVLEQTKDYQLEIEELYGGSVVKLGEELEGLQSGIVDISTVVIVFEMSKLNLHQFAWWFPFGSTDLIQVTKAANMTYDKFPILDKTLENMVKNA